MPKERLDVLLVDRGLVESRSLAQRMIMAGQVRVSGQVANKPSDKVDDQAEIWVDRGPRFVSRGGEKLLAALKAFNLLDLHGKVCADVGASTGGFTDCLLRQQAAHFFAIDVGYGVLHWKIRQDARVTILERSTARNIAVLPQPVDLVTIDASFISLKILLPVVRGWFGEHGQVIALIKPQFEAGRQDAARCEGVIRDPGVHRRVVEEVIEAARADGCGLKGLIRSPLLGPKGNMEFLVWLGIPAGVENSIAEIINPIFEEHP
jgi:23S rRNA (cytidine1920-2'-O)/16S rRNA (cytidine1409-2'-O)-methyltransferase